MTSRSFFVGSTAIALGLMGVLYAPSGAAADPILGLADPFAVLGSTAVTISGAGANITGNVGSATAVTGGAGINFTVGSVTSTSDATAALVAASGAFTFLSGFGAPSDISGPDLGGQTLFAGEYSFSSSAALNGTLTLDAQGNDNAVFIFDIGTALTAGATATAVVNVINGGPGVGVYWLVGSATTLDPNTRFIGNIIDNTESVVLDDNADIVCGRAISLVAGVTMSGGSPTNLVSNNDLANGCYGGFEGGFTSSTTDSGTTYTRVNNGEFVPVTVAVPEPSTLALFSGGIVGLLGLAKRRRRVRLG